QRRLVLGAESQIQREAGRNFPVVLKEDAEIVVASAGGRLGLLILSGLNLAQQQVRNLRVGCSGASVVGDGTIELQQPFRAGGGVVGIELVLAQGRAEFESM